MEDPEKLAAIRDRESDMTKERIAKIVQGAGANVVLTTGGIDDQCLKYFVEAGAMAVRRCKKVDLKVNFFTLSINGEKHKLRKGV